ncbi:WGR domain-containing protein [Rhizobium leguminosarum]|uniref:WGR domain-containing protein n=1 Tax=Rhizobium leguminosarum TaxID=384 RepID=UPI0002F58B82|nr:WGR domain-containing protein [Rhizobium leguminosarum]
MRDWGRTGTDGRLKVELFDTPREAAAAREHVAGRILLRRYRHASAAGTAQGAVTPQGAKTASAGFAERAMPPE